jgi:hypothetical protein
MGLRPERVNEKRYRIQIERGDLMFTISTSISNDGTEVWLNTYGAEIADIAALPPTVMDKLIKASNDYGLSHFIFIAGGKRGVRSLCLHRALDNHGLNPALINHPGGGRRQHPAIMEFLQVAVPVTLIFAS